MKKLRTVGSSAIFDIEKSPREIEYVMEKVEGENSSSLLLRDFTTSSDGKNWDSWKAYNRDSLVGVRGKHIKVRYSLVENFLGSTISIEKPLIKYKSVQTTFIDQGESFLLSGVDSLQDYSRMSIGLQKLEIDMNYFIQQHSAVSVKYWHTNPDLKSKDEFLREYSLQNVVDMKTLKVVLKDNQIPEPRHEFSQWGIEFEKLEVYFEKTYFEEVFGIREEPRRMDYLYFSEINRMYMIQDVYLNHGIGEHGSFYVCTIKKYEDMTNVAKNDDDLEFLKENVKIDDYSDDQIDEMEDMQNTKQNLDNVGVDDLLHSEFDPSLVKSERCDYDNNGNSLGKFIYDMSIGKTGETAIKYLPKVSSKQGISFMFWIELLDDSLSKVIEVDGKPFSISISTKQIVVSGEYSFSLEIDLQKRKFYCVVIGINNEHGFMRFNVYSVNDGDSTILKSLLNHTEPMEKMMKLLYRERSSVLEIDGQMTLITGKYATRQIRVANHEVDETYHSYIMSKSLVKTPSKFFIIDDCRDPLNLDKKSRSLFREINESFLKRRTIH
jgi:hypothetical protein